MAAPLIISGAPRSGTTLLYNLFDSHPDISWMVTEGYFFEYLHDVGTSNGWIYAKLANCGIDQMIDGIRDRDVLPRVHAGYRQIFPGTMQTAVEYEVMWDEAAFRAKLATPSGDTAAELWHKLSRATLAGLGEAEKRYLCLKSPDYGKSAFAALDTIPEAKAIISLRDPLAALDSLKFTREQRNTKRLTWPTLAIVIGQYLRMMEAIARYPQGRLKVVRHEDLLADPGKEMRAVATWLGIEFTEHLVQPSFQGQSWTGHSSRRMTQGIAKELAERRLEHLTPHEQSVIREALGGLLAPYGYTLGNAGTS